MKKTLHLVAGARPNFMKIAPIVRALDARRDAFREFIPKYFSNREAKLSKDWTPDAQMLKEFEDHLRGVKAEFTTEEWTANLDWLKVQLKREALITAVSLDESLRYAVETDPTVEKAIESLPKARALLDSARKQMVQLDKRSNRD